MEEGRSRGEASAENFNRQKRKEVALKETYRLSKVAADEL